MLCQGLAETEYECTDRLRYTRPLTGNSMVQRSVLCNTGGQKTSERRSQEREIIRCRYPYGMPA